VVPRSTWPPGFAASRPPARSWRAQTSLTSRARSTALSRDRRCSRSAVDLRERVGWIAGASRCRQI
jgi:hypothetical protein